MTAKSNQILSELISVLSSAGFALVTTRQLALYELAGNQFPAIVIDSGRETQTIGLNKLSESSWKLTLILSVINTEILSAADNWREHSALIGKTIVANRHLNGLAMKVEIIGRALNTHVYEPWATGTLDLTIRYRFNETEGG